MRKHEHRNQITKEHFQKCLWVLIIYCSNWGEDLFLKIGRTTGIAELTFCFERYSIYGIFILCWQNYLGFPSLLCKQQGIQGNSSDFNGFTIWPQTKPTAVTYLYSPQDAPNLYEHWNKGINADNVPRPQQEAFRNRSPDCEKHWKAVVGWHFTWGTKHFNLGLAVALVAAGNLWGV